MGARKASGAGGGAPARLAHSAQCFRWWPAIGTCCWPLRAGVLYILPLALHTSPAMASIPGATIAWPGPGHSKLSMSARQTIRLMWRRWERNWGMARL